MSHSNISIFVPHLGCPHQCSFCNQRHITGHDRQPTPEDVDSAVELAVSSAKYSPKECEIAFFGGSFTAIEHDYMCSLLSAANRYVEDGTVSGIRISTRPDCIDENILSLLKSYGVTAIELGAQSMVDDVLVANKRGHCARDVVKASEQIKKFGFELGLQMMTGLYMSTDEYDILTCQKLIALSPDTVRIYPTITLENTDLASLYRSGLYRPDDISHTVELCVKLEDMFKKHDIRVIRMGLHSIDIKAYVAGPWHPAFKELCDSLRYRNSLEKVLIKKGNFNIFVNPTDISKAIGQKRANILYFKEKDIDIRVLPKKGIKPGNFITEEVK